MKRIGSLLLSVVLSACVSGLDYTAENGKKKEHFHVDRIIGGSEAARTAGGFEWTGDRNDSFAQAMQFLTVLATMSISAIQSYITETTARLATAELSATERLTLKNNLALAKAELAARGTATGQAIKAAPEKIGPINVNTP